VRGAVARLAEEAYAELTVEQQALTKGVMLRLSTGEGEVVTRRRVPVLEFDPGTNADVGAVLDTLIEARLLIADDGSVEVAHEALLHEWPRLEAWLDEDRAGRRLRGHLADQAKEWERSGKEAGDLYRGLRLASALEWTTDHAKELNNLEREFLSESRAASERETERQQRTNRRLRGLLAGVAVFLVIALVAGGLALVQRGQAREEARRADREARIATARELAAAAVANLEVDPELSILLATEAVQTTRSFDGTVLREAEEALHRAVGSSRVELTVPGLGGWLAWSPEGVFVTEGPEDSGLIDMRDAQTGRSVLSFQGHDGDVNQVAFSSDGSRLASTGDDGELKVWDPSSGRLLSSLSAAGSAYGPSFSADGSLVAAAWDGKGSVRVLDLSTDRVVSSTRVLGVIDTALSPDGKRIAVASESGTGAVFDVETGERAFRLSRGDSQDVAWSPDGRYVAATSYQSTQVWEAVTGRLQHTLGHGGFVYSVAWSPDSSRLVAGGSDGIAKVWEIGVKTVRELWSLSAHGTRSGVSGVAFSPDGSRVMAGDLNVSAVTIWDLERNGDAEWAHLPSHGPPARFLPDGRRVVASSRAGKAVTIWGLTGSELETIAAATDDFSLSRLAVNLDGESVAVGGWVVSDDRRFGGQVARVWDLATERELFRIWHRLDVNEVTYSPDGDYLATGSWDGTAKIVDSSGRVIRVLREERGSNVSDVAFSPDGRQVATTVFTYTGRPEGRVRIWNWERGEPVRTIKPDISVAGVPVSVDFDPTGSRIVTAGDNGLGVIWDVKSGSRVAVLTGQGGVSEAAFSPDGARVATASSDGTVRLFDAETGAEQLVLGGSGCAVWGVAFSPDGTKLASTSCDGVRIWALDIDDLLEIAHQEARRSLTDEECRQYLHVEECPASI